MDLKLSNQHIKFINPEFIHQDDRGILVQLSSTKKWGQVNYIKSDSNSVRGNHYHEINRELFYVVEGNFTLTLEYSDTKLIYDMVEGDMFVIEPMVRHSFNYKTKTILISMYDLGVELDSGKKDILV